MLDEQELRKTVEAEMVYSEEGNSPTLEPKSPIGNLQNLILLSPKKLSTVEEEKKEEVEEILVNLENKWSEAELLEALKKVRQQP